VLVDEIRIERMGELVLLRVVGSHFLWKMVRRLAGVLVEVGKGNIAPNQMAKLLANDSSDVAKLTAPASGLFLERVFYEGDERKHELRPAFGID
jgi:tRNA pseudouridine38-40 synthase